LKNAELALNNNHTLDFQCNRGKEWEYKNKYDIFGQNGPRDTGYRQKYSILTVVVE